MLKKSFITVMVVITCCLTMCLSGCFSNKGAADVSSSTPTTIPSSVTKTPDTTPPAQTTTSIPTTPPNNATQIPDSASANQADPTETANTTGINTGLPDGTKVKLFVSGQEIENHEAIIIDGEALVYDETYIFGQLKDAGGIEWSGFFVIGTIDVKTNKRNSFIYNSSYTIDINEGEYSFVCNDVILPLTVPAQTIDEHFYIPLIAIAEAIEATVEWDADAQVINFFYK